MFKNKYMKIYANLSLYYQGKGISKVEASVQSKPLSCHSKLTKLLYSNL